jgi:hypothetical protein
MLSKNQKIKLWLSWLIVLVISTQSVLARADAHQLHSEDMNFLSVDEHSHVISGAGIVDQSESAAQVGNTQVPQVDCEHGHIHINTVSFVTGSFILPAHEILPSLCTILKPLLQIGIRTLPFRPPIS